MDLVLHLILLFAALSILRRQPKRIAVLFMAFGVYFTPWSLWQGHYGSQFVGGEEVEGIIVDKRIEEDWTKNYFVTVSWSGKDGVERSLELKTMADFFGYYEAGQKETLVISKKSPELVLMKSDLKFILSIGPIFFSPMIFFGLGGIGMAFLVWFYADQIRDSYKKRPYKETDYAVAPRKKWRWDDEP